MTEPTLPRHKLLWAQNAGTQLGMITSLDEESTPMTIEKSKIQGAVLELPTKQRCWASLFASFLRWMA